MHWEGVHNLDGSKAYVADRNVASEMGSIFLSETPVRFFNYLYFQAYSTIFAVEVYIFLSSLI